METTLRLVNPRSQIQSRPLAPEPLDALEAATRIRRWGEERDWTGWDPYDALSSPWAGAVTLRTALGRRILTQAVKRSSVNLRPALRIPKSRNHKAIGLVASAYSYLGAAGDDAARSGAGRWLDWLEREHVGGSDGLAWAYHFDVQTRFFSYPANSPNTIATTFVALAFLDAVEQLDDGARVEAAVRAAEFLVARMLVDGPRGPYFIYVPGDEKLIHNCNLLACATLIRAARCSGRDDLAQIAARAVATSLEAQRPDGSWPYSDWSGQGWVDNFHTGYVLESLAACSTIEGVGDALAAGASYWERELFLEDGTPKYSPGRTEPLDAHCYAQAIDTWLALDAVGRPGLAQAQRTARLLVRDMLLPNGSVVFQRRRGPDSRVPFIRWTAAPSFRALARLSRATGARGS